MLNKCPSDFIYPEGFLCLLLTGCNQMIPEMVLTISFGEKNCQNDTLFLPLNLCDSFPVISL